MIKVEYITSDRSNHDRSDQMANKEKETCPACNTGHVGHWVGLNDVYFTCHKCKHQWERSSVDNCR